MDGVAEGVRGEEPARRLGGRLGGRLGLDGSRIGEVDDRLPRCGDGLSAERGSVRPVWQIERDLSRVATLREDPRHLFKGVGHGAADLGRGRSAAREQVDRGEDFQGGRRRPVETGKVRGPHAQFELGQTQPVADFGAPVAKGARQLGPERGRRPPQQVCAQAQPPGQLRRRHPAGMASQHGVVDDRDQRRHSHEQPSIEKSARRLLAQLDLAQLVEAVADDQADVRGQRLQLAG